MMGQNVSWSVRGLKETFIFRYFHFGMCSVSCSSTWRSKVGVLGEEPWTTTVRISRDLPRNADFRPTSDQQVWCPMFSGPFRWPWCIHPLRTTGVGDPRPQAHTWVPGVHRPYLPTSFPVLRKPSQGSCHSGVGEPPNLEQNGTMQKRNSHRVTSTVFLWTASHKHKPNTRGHERDAISWQEGVPSHIWKGSCDKTTTDQGPCRHRRLSLKLWGPDIQDQGTVRFGSWWGRSACRTDGHLLAGSSTGREGGRSVGSLP